MLTLKLITSTETSVPWEDHKARRSMQYSLKSRLSLIVRVNVVLNRTVVVDSD